MIPRHQRILFWILLVSSVVMSVILIRLRERAHDRLLDASQTMPLNPPSHAAAQDVTLMIANDANGSLTSFHEKIALPGDENARAHVVLQRLISIYAQPGSAHPIAANSGVHEIFFLPLPPAVNTVVPGEMAVVNLSGSFAAEHPSGIEPETLTLLSILGTLHANFPDITQVRFLVDGQPRETLAGHADLSRVYLAADSPDVKHL
ncbi:MAG TPA: GerMN domain-containing protein [Acidobacteriaceae bacterium]|nr:GerMN domain-containing protein [Acidobacteriaceae bacterium]